MVGGIAAGTIGLQASGSYSENQLNSGLSSQMVSHSEAEVGLGGVVGGSVEVGLGESGDPCFTGIGGGIGLKGGTGLALYAGTGLGASGYATSPSIREMFNYLSRLNWRTNWRR
jgi:hypothetical protein